jgi:hypothetical protein
MWDLPESQLPRIPFIQMGREVDLSECGPLTHAMISCVNAEERADRCGALMDAEGNDDRRLHFAVLRMKSLRYLELLGAKFAQGCSTLLANDGAGVIAQAVAQHVRSLRIGTTRSALGLQRSQ